MDYLGGGTNGMLGQSVCWPPSQIIGGPAPLFLRLCSFCSLGSQQPVRVADIVGLRTACSVYGKG